MGTWVRHVVIVIYALITSYGEHVVKSKQFGDGQINQCHDGNGDCSTERTKSYFLLGLPRLDAVKAKNVPRSLFATAKLMARKNGLDVCSSFWKVGYTQEMELTKGSIHTVKTVSLQPPVFEIPNFFTDEECEMIIDLAQEKGLKDSPLTLDTDNIDDKDSTDGILKAWDRNEDGFVDKDEALYQPGKRNVYMTEEDVLEMFKALNLDQDKDGRIPLKNLDHTSLENIHAHIDKEVAKKPRMRSQNSEQVWLWHDDDELLQYEGLLEDYHERIEQLTKLPKPILQQSEPLQVVRYKEGGHYHCHHDSEEIAHDIPCCLYGSKDCRLCRYLTIMVFLNDVAEGGECAFPIADNRTFSWKAWSKQSPHRCNMVTNCAESNLVIKPQRGKAVMWYNHKLRGSQGWFGDLDPLSYQGSCEVKKSEKWVAKIWVNINGDGRKELRAWKMGHNWLAENNRNEEIMNMLQTEVVEETVAENRYTKHKNVEVNDGVKIDLVGHTNVKEESSWEENTEAKEDSVTYYTQNKQQLTEESLKDSSKATPEGPKLSRTETSSPLPLTEEQMTPKGPPVGQLPTQGFEGSRIVQSIMLLLEELDQVELEIIARNLHTKLKLVCVPLIVNPMGRL